MTQPFFTIGHSTRPTGEFVELLRPNEVARVIDVRSFPRSRTNPQYNIEALPAALAPHGIAYEHIASLGGKRGRSKDVPADVNAFWEVEGFRNYADYALGEDFRAGFERLLRVGERERVAVMCAEALWWRCHRRIIADVLVSLGIRVVHIRNAHTAQAHQLTAPARLVRGVLTYALERRA